MTVFVNRYRRAFLKDRSLQEMVVATLVMLLFLGLMGMACCSDHLDYLEMLRY